MYVTQALAQLDDVAQLEEVIDAMDAPEVVATAAEPLETDVRSATPQAEADAEVEADDDEFDVEAILEERPRQKSGGQAHFLIRWLGYGPEHDTWEPEDCVSADLVASFRTAQARSPAFPLVAQGRTTRDNAWQALTYLYPLSYRRRSACRRKGRRKGSDRSILLLR